MADNPARSSARLGLGLGLGLGETLITTDTLRRRYLAIPDASPARPAGESFISRGVGHGHSASATPSHATSDSARLSVGVWSPQRPTP